MFQTPPGVTIPFPDKIQEQFQVYEGNSIYANISFEKLKPILTEFYHSLPEPILTDRQKVRLTNTFSQETPGECRRVSINGFDVYDVAEQLKKQGMYRAKIIES